MNLAEPLECEDSLQFFREEQTEGAVYNVYLKKVRYHTPSSNLDEEEETKSHLQWKTIEIRVIKAGTLDNLVECLSSDTGELDSTYVNVFLSTYRAFSSPKQVLNLILERYRQISEDVEMKQQAKDGHLKTIRIVLSVWMDGFLEDFREPPNYPCLNTLISFATRHMESSDLCHRAQHKLDKFKKEEDSAHGPVISVEDIEFHFNTLLEEVSFTSPLEESCLTRPVEFETIPEWVFAEQLTYMDSELFKKVVPHHCLGSVWSRRDKKAMQAPSVYATVNQFNMVSYRVLATVLKHPLDISRTDRAKIIEKWISIAQELRILKNFSSLKAIISGLQSNSVYRLRKVWNDVDKEFVAAFQELAEIFSGDNNQMMARELLMKEGTAKFADTESGMNTIARRRKSINPFLSTRKSTGNWRSVQGTVPYLGTFLTDLTMVDTAIPDYNEDGLINFEKRRKEFEILAQIKLLQSAASMYHIKPDQAFFEWFHNIRVYDDNESYELSCEIEPTSLSTPKEATKGHRKKSSLGFFTPRRPISMGDDLSWTTSSSSSYQGDEADAVSVPSTPSDCSGLRVTPLRHSMSMTSLRSGDDVSVSPWNSPETKVVKVAMETNDSHHTNHYKSIALVNSDHTKNVIKNILMKFNIEDRDTDDFVIFQKLSDDKELQLPDKGNLFYAINNNVPQIMFVVRNKTENDHARTRPYRKKKVKKMLLK